MVIIIIIIIIVFNIVKSQRSTNICHAGQPHTQSRPRLPRRTANGAWPALGGRRLRPGPIDLDTEPTWNSSWSLCTHKLMISAYYSFIDPERMKGWVDLDGWPAADGLPTWVVTRQLQVGRRTGKVRRPKTDVLLMAGWHQKSVSWEMLRNSMMKNWDQYDNSPANS